MNIVNLVLNNFTNDSRVLKSSLTLKEVGFSVVVVALHEKNLPEIENTQGVDVERIKLSTKSFNFGKLFQLIKLFEFIVRFACRYRKSDCVHCNDLDALLVGVVCKVFNSKIKIVYDAHEYEINDRPFQSDISIKARFFLERFLIKFAEKVITVSPSIASEYSRLYKGVSPELVLNCPRYTDSFNKGYFRKRFGISLEAKIFLYNGALSRGRGIEQILDVFSGSSGEYVIIFMGYGELESIIRSRECETIFLHEVIPIDEVIELASSADFGISFIEDCCLSYRYCLPNKLFEYFMAGIPALVSNLPEMAALVSQKGVGVITQDNSTLALKKSIDELLSLNYSELLKNVNEVRKQYCWERQEEVLIDIYRRIETVGKRV